MTPLGTEPSPREDPLSYPGRPPRQSAVLTREGVLDLAIDPSAPLEAATVAGGVPLAELLAAERAPAISARRAVLCIGSNAAPTQLVYKFERAGEALTTPMVQLPFTGLIPGVAARVSRPGYLPASPVLAPDSHTDLFVIWLDPAQLAAMDVTERTYTRRTLQLDRGPVGLAGPVPEWASSCDLYTSDHGTLVIDGDPVALRPQRELQALVRGAVPGISEVMGGTPADWINLAADPSARKRVHDLLRDAGVVASQPYFEGLSVAPGATS